jgi:hypothetical protein
LCVSTFTRKVRAGMVQAAFSLAILALLLSMLAAVWLSFRTGWDMALLAHLNAHQAVELSAVKIVHNATGRSLLASHDILPEAEVIALARSLIITPEELVPDESPLGTLLTGLDADPKQRLLLGMLALKTDELMLQGSIVATTARMWLRSNIQYAPQHSYAYLEPVVAQNIESVEWLQKLTATFGWSKFLNLSASILPLADDADVRAIFGLVESRTFELELPFQNVTQEAVVVRESLAIMPLLDMVNHALDPNLGMHCDEAGCWLQARRVIAAGEELTISCALRSFPTSSAPDLVSHPSL